MDDADLTGANLEGLHWLGIASLKNTHIDNVKNAPLGFVLWALQAGALAAPGEMLRQPDKH